MTRFLFSLFLTVTILSSPVFAQETKAPESEEAKKAKAAEVKANARRHLPSVKFVW
jgi:hypothetical protein